MSFQQNKELILSLIKDDLIHARLVLGLKQLGLETEHHVINLSETIFKLLGIADDETGEALYEHYLELREKVIALDVNNEEGLEELVKEVWGEVSGNFLG